MPPLPRVLQLSKIPSRPSQVIWVIRVIRVIDGGGELGARGHGARRLQAPGPLALDGCARRSRRRPGARGRGRRSVRHVVGRALRREPARTFAGAHLRRAPRARWPPGAVSPRAAGAARGARASAPARGPVGHRDGAGERVQVGVANGPSTRWRRREAELGAFGMASGRRLERPVFAEVPGRYESRTRSLLDHSVITSPIEMASRLSYSASLVTQGDHRFFTLTMPSDVLGRTCFVSTRDSDPKGGFQRLLDKKRAQEIATYIDAGLGTIPTSIVLSAQASSDLIYIRPRKTLEFNDSPESFLILDGQHRVYGFSLAKAALRVPVVVYPNLSRRDESRIFIDINTKQRPVPNELLLDIKKLAEYETDDEARLNALFDRFNDNPDSPLSGLLSPHERKTNKISRVTFNASVRPLLPLFASSEADEVYDSLASYISAHIACLGRRGASDSIVKPPFFKAAMKLFAAVAQRVKDRHGSDYRLAHFEEVLSQAYDTISAAKLKKPGANVGPILDSFQRGLQRGFIL